MRVPVLIPLVTMLLAQATPAWHTAVHADDVVQLHASTTLSEQEDLVVQVLVARNKDNQLMRVTAESENYFSSSEMELPGEYAPRVEVVRFRSVPIGVYQVTGTVYDRRGKVKGMARTSLLVVPR